MKRILIVEDEYIVRLGLKTIVDWAEYGYVVAGEAGNGREGLELFERLGAELILTDIKMPVMDGLALTREIRKRDTKIPIIILTHYDEFTYAQEAIRLGAFRYILKSELTKTNLLTMIQSLTVQSEAETPAKAVPPDPGIELWEGYIKQYLFPLFNGSGDQALPPPQSELSFRSGLVMAGSCRMSALLSEARGMFPKTLKVLFTDAFPQGIFFGDYQRAQFQLILLVPLGAPQGTCDERAGKIVPICSRIVKNIRQYYDTGLFLGLSTLGPLTDTVRLVSESCQALKMGFFSEKDFISLYTPLQQACQGKPPPISYTKLTELVERNQKEAVLEYIQNIFRTLRSLKKYTYVQDAFYDFLSIAKLIREKYHLEEQAALSEGKFSFGIFYDMDFIADVEFYLYTIFLALLAGKQGGNIMYSFIVKKCIAFIHHNYTQNVSLSDAARHVEVSHSYLSFLFKQETGINFNTYLSQYRIEQAKHLLGSTNMRIYEVAQQVGFSNPYYFSKVFKECCGISCKQFRDRFLSKE